VCTLSQITQAPIAIAGCGYEFRPLGQLAHHAAVVRKCPFVQTLPKVEVERRLVPRHTPVTRHHWQSIGGVHSRSAADGAGLFLAGAGGSDLPRSYEERKDEEEEEEVEEKRGKGEGATEEDERREAMGSTERQNHHNTTRARSGTSQRENNKCGRRSVGDVSVKLALLNENDNLPVSDTSLEPFTDRSPSFCLSTRIGTPIHQCTRNQPQNGICSYKANKLTDICSYHTSQITTFSLRQQYVRFSPR
jgi:hypothetical protein